MVNLVSKLKQWTEEYLEGSEQFLVDVENKPGSNKYTVLVDGIEAISIKRCGMISRQLSKRMDEDTDIDEDYNFIFEVSSPGADRSLKIVKQYPKHIGRELDIVTTDEKKITGTLEAVEEETIVLNIQISKKETALERIEFKDIKEANVIISFKETKR